MDLKKLLNLNSYEWWRNHRRFVTLGVFIALAAGYIRAPIAKEFNLKDTCLRYKAFMITEAAAGRKLNVTARTSHGLPNANQLRYNLDAYCSGYGNY